MWRDASFTGCAERPIRKDAKAHLNNNTLFNIMENIKTRITATRTSDLG